MKPGSSFWTVLALGNRHRDLHPYRWRAFVLSGDGPLDRGDSFFLALDLFLITWNITPQVFAR